MTARLLKTLLLGPGIAAVGIAGVCVLLSDASAEDQFVLFVGIACLGLLAAGAVELFAVPLAAWVFLKRPEVRSAGLALCLAAGLLVLSAAAWIGIRFVRSHV